MTLSEKSTQDFLDVFSNAKKLSEGGIDYFFLPQHSLPEGCSPEKVDLLLCPTSHHGYSSRLFFAEKINGCPNRNWNKKARILDRNWHAFSWKIKNELNLVQMLSVHLGGLRNE